VNNTIVAAYRGAVTLPPFRVPTRWGRDGDLTRACLRLLPPVLLIGALALAIFSTWVYGSGRAPLGLDAHAYWVAGREAHPYAAAPGAADAVLYSPAFVLAMRLMALLPWAPFLLLWMTAAGIAFWWLSAPLPWRWRAPVLAACWPAVLIGNINALLCVCLVVGLTASWAVAPIALTKITPAFAPALWWACRGEWRRLAGSVAVTGAIALVSYALAPGLWSEWVAFLRQHSDESTLRLLRIAAGVLVAGWAALTGRPWLLGIAFYLLMPMATLQIQALVPLMVIPRLWKSPVQPRARGRRETVTHVQVSRA
jgi:hypothetical protein